MYSCTSNTWPRMPYSTYRSTKFSIPINRYKCCCHRKRNRRILEPKRMAADLRFEIRVLYILHRGSQYLMITVDFPESAVDTIKCFGHYRSSLARRRDQNTQNTHFWGGGPRNGFFDLGVWLATYRRKELDQTSKSNSCVISLLEYSCRHGCREIDLNLQL